MVALQLNTNSLVLMTQLVTNTRNGPCYVKICQEKELGKCFHDMEVVKKENIPKDTERYTKSRNQPSFCVLHVLQEIKLFEGTSMDRSRLITEKKKNIRR